jgi:hypothetical protein
MSQFEENVFYVRQALAQLEALRDSMPKTIMDEWKIGEDNSRIVDTGRGIWAYVDDSESRTDRPVPLADWICIFNPVLVGALLQVVEDHLQGLEHLWATSPDELREHIKVSDAVMEWAKSVQNYLIKEEVLSETGEWMQPRRRLQVTEWEEDV